MAALLERKSRDVLPVMGPRDELPLTDPIDVLAETGSKDAPAVASWLLEMS